jgi:glycerophosphoryl diester phosphodiesterase
MRNGCTPSIRQAASASSERVEPLMNPWPYPPWIAHRGAGKLAPENTLAAFRVGAQHGHTCFECDVKLSRDGVPFLMHDAELARTTGQPGLGGDHDWNDLAALDAGSWHSAAYAGEPLPTLERIATFVRANGFTINLEIKPTPGLEAETGRAVAQYAQRLWAGADVPPLLSSFRPESLLAAMQAAPELLRALLLDEPWNGWAAIATQLRVVAIITNHRKLDATLAAQAKDVATRLLAYTVNEPADAMRVRSLGVDGVITDAVDQWAANSR